MLLQPISADDDAEFLAAVHASRKLHGPWVAPPPTPEAFAAFVNCFQGDARRGYVVRAPGSAALVGYFGITNIVRVPLCSAYLGYYASAGFERKALM